MSNDNPLLSFFPHTDKIKSIRSNQKEALDKLWEKIELGHKNITIAAPVGSGKSAIGDTLFNYYNSLNKNCLYTSPLNQLVDQVELSGFTDVCTLKGRVHYTCLAGKQNAGVGYCQTNEKCPSSNRKRNCKHKPYGACDTCMCPHCEYKKVYTKFKNSHKGNTNFTLFLIGIDNNPDIIVIDESDVLESFIRSHYSITIPIMINDPVFKHHIEPLKIYLDSLQIKIENIDPNSDVTTESQLKELKELMAQYEKISNMLSDFETNQEAWVVTVNTEKQKTKYEPITIDRFLSPLLAGKIVFMMSATPPQFKEYTKLEVDSIFPIETRQWSYLPLGKMSFHHRDATIPKVALWLSKLRGKTLCHCVSYLTAKKISDALRILGIYPLLQINDSNGDEHTTSRYDAVEAFVKAEDPNKILLSVKLDRGVDFWQPEIINNVICVLPYPNPTEALTKAKNRLLSKDWQNEQMARDIAQAMGRIFRNEKMGILNGIATPKRGFIVASEFGVWYNQNKKLFPKWFIESQYIAYQY